MKRFFGTSYLFIAGLTMTMVGIYIAIMTREYMTAMTPQIAAPSINMLSELRGMGGMLLMLGIYLLISVFRKAWQNSALIIAALVYTSFALFRSLSFAFDGMPEMTVITAYLIEIVLAIVGIFLIKQQGFDAAANKGLAEKQLGE